MKIVSNACLAVCLALMFAFASDNTIPVKETLKVVQTQLMNMAMAHSDSSMYPRSIKKDGTTATVPSRDWTSGFFPGDLWYMYDYTKDRKWETLARRWTTAMAKEQYNKGTHDLGFMLYSSYGNGYRLTKDPAYKAILIQGAKSLITRFNKNTGTIKSWDHGSWQYPVIIDNMMNLELLYWASKITGDPVYKNVANTHALTTIKNHFRPDNSSYHVVDYDTATGKVLKRVTHQGYAAESAWTRGQAWGLYGYTVAYRETKDKRFLQQAQKIADFFINHPNMPADHIPYWDFDAPNIPNAPRDASAAAIASSGLLELSKYLPAKHDTYMQAARNMLGSLTSAAYLAKPGENNNFILMHSTGHLPNNSEIDVPINYADYYFIEALLRFNNLSKK